VIIVWIVAHRLPAGCLVCRREPQCGENCLRDRREFWFYENPPLGFPIFRLGTNPIKNFQQQTPNLPSLLRYEKIPILRAKLGITRRNQVTEMLRPSVPPCVVAAFLIIAVTGCEKKSGEAVVLAKEHIDAALPTGETPNAQSAPSPDEQPRPIADD